MPDFAKPGGQDMQEETANEFFNLKRHWLHLVSVGIVAPEEGYLSIFQEQNPIVGNCYPMRIAAKIGNDLVRAAKWRLAINHPLFCVTRIKQSLVCIRKFVFQQSQKFAAKFGGENANRQEKIPLGYAPFGVRGQTATGNDHMNVRVKLKILTPSVQHSGDSRLCTKILPVCA